MTNDAILPDSYVVCMYIRLSVEDEDLDEKITSGG